MKTFVCAAILVCGWWSPASAAPGAGNAPLPGHLHFEHLGLEQGLPHNSLYRIYQDRDGFIWLATVNGLARYDGFEIRVFRHDPADTDTIAGSDAQAVLHDREGFLWVGTDRGLSRVHPDTGRVNTFRHDPGDPGSISHDDVRALHEDDDGRLWVGTLGGLNLFQPDNGRFRLYRYDTETPSSNRVLHIAADPEGGLWLATAGGGLMHFEPGRERFRHFRAQPGNPSSLPDDHVSELLVDGRGRLWAATNRGLARLRDEGSGFEVFRHDPSDPQSLSHDVVNAVVEDDRGLLWVGTNEGLNRLDPASGRVERILQEPTDPDSLSGDAIWSLMVDRDGVLWIGTLNNGVDLLDPVGRALRFARHNPMDADSLSHSNVFDFHEAPTGRIWVATHGGGLNYFDPGAGSWRALEGEHELSGNLAWSVYLDSHGRVWAGTFGDGLNRVEPDGSVRVFRHRPDDPGSLSSDDVRHVLEDSRGRIWVTARPGLHRYDPGNDGFRIVPHGAGAVRQPGEVWGFAVTEDSGGTIWAGFTNTGLARLDEDTGQLEFFTPDPGDPDSLGSENVLDLFEDSRGRLWVGTGYGGLHRFEPETGGFARYTTADGLPEDAVMAITEDRSGRLWFSGTRSINRLDADSGEVRTVHLGDYVPESVFNPRAVLASRSGHLYFGSTQGYVTFDPEALPLQADPPPVVLTELQLFGETVPVSSPERETPLKRRIRNAQSITLDHTQSVFSVQFAALQFLDPDANRFAYRLLGFDDAWHTTDAGRPFATYTNLNPGRYRFQVRAANPFGAWSEEPRTLEITVLPPPWKTWWAFLLYAMALSGLAAWYLVAQRRKLERERNFVVRLQQADRTKDEFLANTSQELRTPLHGIIGIAESLREGVSGDLPQAMRRQLDMIASSGKRLSRMIKDILDFSQLRNRTLHLDVRPVDFHGVAQATLDMLRPTVRDRDLHLLNAVPADLPAVLADEERLGQILHNLVSNSIKFTREGRIVVSATSREGRAEIAVSDTGVGIPETEQETIFYAFHQSGGGRADQGSGLGLAITQQLVAAHGGRIRVDSDPGRGTTFTFTLPLAGRPARRESRRAARRSESPQATTALPAVVPDSDHERARILVVDDDPVNRRVLMNYLILAGYRPAEAHDGESALRQVDEMVPDVVLLDLVMPRQSGIEICERIRQRFSLNDMAVILITADHRQSDMVRGFEAGANDYLTKPVAREELVARVRAHLHLVDVHRNLEARVRDRTLDLEDKNRELETARASLEQASFTDPLTGLRNRRFLVRFIEQDVQVAVRKARSAGGRTREADLVFFLADLDDFKGVNDRFGHDAGDVVLVEVRKVLESLFRGSDYLVRWGGEEFLAVARFIDRDGAPRMAERLRRLIAEHPIVLPGDHVLYMTWSIGYAAFPFFPGAPENFTWSQAITVADNAMYAVKRRGGDGWAGFEPGPGAEPESLFERMLRDPVALLQTGELRIRSSFGATLFPEEEAFTTRYQDNP